MSRIWWALLSVVLTKMLLSFLFLCWSYHAQGDRKQWRFTLVMELGRDNQRRGVGGCGEQGHAALHSCSSQRQRRKLWEQGSGDTTLSTCCAFAVYPGKLLELIVFFWNTFWGLSYLFRNYIFVILYDESWAYKFF